MLIALQCVIGEDMHCIYNRICDEIDQDITSQVLGSGKISIDVRKIFILYLSSSPTYPQRSQPFHHLKTWPTNSEQHQPAFVQWIAIDHPDREDPHLGLISLPRPKAYFLCHWKSQLLAFKSMRLRSGVSLLASQVQTCLRTVRLLGKSCNVW